VKKLPTYFYIVPIAIMAIAFLVGQGKEGAGVPVVILLSTMFFVYALRWSAREKSNG